MGVTSGGKIEADRFAYLVPIGAPPGVVANWKLAGLSVNVPEALSISRDPNTQFPRERIVWWGEPEGDRRAQVQRIVTDAVLQGASGLRGRVPVNIAVEVKLFHAVTPMARNGNYFAWHDIQFSIQINDATSGALLAFDPDIDADIEALRGVMAREATARGETQKVRITRRIAQVVQSWLASSNPSAGTPPAAAVTALVPSATRQAVVAAPRRPIVPTQTATGTVSAEPSVQASATPTPPAEPDAASRSPVALPDVLPVLDVACGYDPNGQRCLASKAAAGQ